MLEELLFDELLLLEEVPLLKELLLLDELELDELPGVLFSPPQLLSRMATHTSAAGLTILDAMRPLPVRDEARYVCISYSAFK